MPKAQDDEDSPLVSILFGTYNRRPLLERCVEAIPAAVGPLPYEIVVADGGSTDGSREWLLTQKHTVLVEGGLEGAVKAFNAAFDAARGQYVCTLNDDCVPQPMAVANAIAVLQDNPKVGQIALGFFNEESPTPATSLMFRTLPYANFGVLPMPLAQHIRDIQGGLWWPGYHTYAGDCELSCWVQRLGWTVLPLASASVLNTPAADGLREANARRARQDARNFYRRWRFNGNMVSPLYPLDEQFEEDLRERYAAFVAQDLDRTRLPEAPSVTHWGVQSSQRTLAVVSAVGWRNSTLSAVIAELRTQSEVLVLLDEGAEAPAGTPTLTVPEEWRGKGHLARLLPWWLDALSDPLAADTIVLFCDDDFSYPGGYVEKTARALIQAEKRAFQQRAAVSWCGQIGSDSVRWDFELPQAQALEGVGTGTSAMRAGLLRTLEPPERILQPYREAAQVKADPLLRFLLWRAGALVERPAGSAGLVCRPSYEDPRSLWKQRDIDRRVNALMAEGWPGLALRFR